MAEYVMDCETLGTKWNAVILSFAIVKLDLENDNNSLKTDKDIMSSFKSYYTKLNREEQIKKGRVVEQSTVDWWKKQTAEGAVEVLNNNNCISIEQFIKELKNFLIKTGFNPKTDYIFSRRFIDSYWINSLIEDFTGMKNFFSFWCFRETVTALQCLTGEPEGYTIPEELTKTLPKHNALADCTMDGIKLTRAFCPYEEPF